MTIPHANKRWMRIAAAMFSGGCLALVAPPANLWWLHWFSWVPMFWALYPGTVKQNLRLGYLAGWFGMFCIFFWVVETVQRFSSLNLALSFVILGLFASAFGLYYAVTFGSAMWFRKKMGANWVFVVPAVHVAMENLSPALFPYYEGVTQYRVPAMFQLASVLGSLGLTYLLFLVNCILAESVFRNMEGRKQAWHLYGIAGGLIVANLAFGTWRHSAVEEDLAKARTIRTAIIQQDVTMEERFDDTAWDLIDSWLTRTASIANEKPDLVVWPEAAVRVNPHGSNRYRAFKRKTPKEFFSNLSGEGDFHLLMGGGTRERGRDEQGKKWIKDYNSAYSFTRKGEPGQRYDKMVPLPFGEYIPLADVFPVLRTIVQGPGNFRKGTNVTAFEAVDSEGEPYTYSAPICYEGILNGQMGKLSAVDLFINITNDAWFGDTGCPHQHAMLTAGQAVQYGRPLLRIAYTGISWVVEPHGDILYETAPFTESASVETIRLGTVDTVYKRGGWLFPYVCGLFAAGTFLFYRRRKEEGGDA